MRSKGIQLPNDAHWLSQLQKDTTLFRGHLFKMASNNLSVNIISDEELAQKRQDLLNKNTIKSENNAKRKFEAYLKVCHIKNYEEWITFSDEKLDDSQPGARIRIPRSAEGDTNSGSRLRGVNLVYPSDLWNKCYYTQYKFCFKRKRIKFSPIAFQHI